MLTAQLDARPRWISFHKSVGQPPILRLPLFPAQIIIIIIIIPRSDQKPRQEKKLQKRLQLQSLENSTNVSATFFGIKWKCVDRDSDFRSNFKADFK